MQANRRSLTPDEEVVLAAARASLDGAPNLG